LVSIRAICACKSMKWNEIWT